VLHSDRSDKKTLKPPSAHIRQARQDVHDLFMLLSMTGGRWSEIVGLTWSQIDIRQFERLTIWGNKTQKSRLVPLPQKAQDVLRRRLEGRNGHLVFPGKDPEKPLTTQVTKAIERAMSDCGLNAPTLVDLYGRATTHSLRHTFASWLLQNDADLAEVQAMLGHTTLAMTLRYAHLSLGKTAKKMGKLLDAVVPD